MTDETEDRKSIRPPRRRTAFLLNLFFPPAGYVYAGMPWVGVACAFAFVVCALWGLAVQAGRDVPAHLPQAPLTTLLLALFSIIGAGLFTGIHVAFRLREHRAHGAKSWVLAGVLYLIVLGAWFVSHLVQKA